MSTVHAPVVLSIVTTVETREQALGLARLVVQERLAACAQVDEAPITSVYAWQGERCESAEVRLTFKTLPGCEPALQALVRRHHPYEVPQWLVSPATASADYAAWVAASVDAGPVG